MIHTTSKRPAETEEAASARDRRSPTATIGAAPGQPTSQTDASHPRPGLLPEVPAKKLRVALVGLGRLVVEEVLPALKLSSRCEVTALVTGHREKGELLADAIALDRDRIRAYDDIPRFSDDDSIDAVYIATPNALHARDTIAALDAGKHVLCEKPMATTLEDCDAMIAAAKRNDRTLMVAYRVHHEPINQTIRRMLLEEQRYGKPHFVTFDTVLDVGRKPQYRLDRSLAGGGSLFDIGIYALNTTCWLLGETPIAVNAMQHNDPDDPRFDQVEENVAFQLRFPSGCIATCTSSYGTARVNRYRIICDRGWMGMDPATHYRGITGEHGDNRGRTELARPESVNQFTAEFDHFAKSIERGEPVESPGEEGRRDLRLMLAIYEAARSGTTVRIT